MKNAIKGTTFQTNGVINNGDGTAATDSNWYNCANKEWANAKDNRSYFVRREK